MSRWGRGASSIRNAFRRSLYLAVIALVVLILYTAEVQLNSPPTKAIDAGVIQSGGKPDFYFDLYNSGQSPINYTYVLAYNTTSSAQEYNSSVTVPPGQTFHYDISLTRPASGVIVITLAVYAGSTLPANRVYQQMWVLRPTS